MKEIDIDMNILEKVIVKGRKRIINKEKERRIENGEWKREELMMKEGKLIGNEIRKIGKKKERKRLKRDNVEMDEINEKSIERERKIIEKDNIGKKGVMME